MLVSFVLSFFPRDVLDEILNLIGSVSEGFPSYSHVFIFLNLFDLLELLVMLMTNTRNKILTAKLLRQGYRYHKLRKTFSKFYRRPFDIVSK